jgi:hypothetical protein
VLAGDTDLLGAGRGNGGSGALSVGGSAVLRATERVIDRGRRIAAHLLEAAPDDVALRRQIMLGDYDPDHPVIIPQKKDIRYRSWKQIKSPQSNAVIVFMMDVSGSMGEEQKELVRLESFWIDTWLRKNYDGIESRYIVHDVAAREVDKHTFYHLREDGGTKISSAYKAAKQLLDSHYAPDEWNIYLFHFSDGDNSSEADSRDCVKVLREQLLPICNMFGYCQVASAYGSGNFINVLHEHLRGHEKVLTSRVNTKDDIYDSLKTFFAKGH